MSDDLGKYGFVSAAWKRGLVIGFLTLQSIAIIWLFTTTVNKSTYNDMKKDMQRQLDAKDIVIREQGQRIDNYGAKLERVLAYGVSGLEDVRGKAEALESVVKQNAKTYNSTRNTLQNEARNN